MRTTATKKSKPTPVRIEGVTQQTVRCDVRVPLDLYTKIEAIAVRRGIKPHHQTNRPMVSPIILELLELGLKSLGDEQPPTDRSALEELEAKLTTRIEAIEKAIGRAIAKAAISTSGDD